MNLKNICLKIEHFQIVKEIDEFLASEFFNEIGESIRLYDLNCLERKQLVDALFHFLEKQDTEMEANFSFIHLIESIDKPNYTYYNKKLLSFNKKNGTLTSMLLLNRYINTLKGNEWRNCLQIFKSISENMRYTEYVRADAKSFYEYQITKNS